MVQYRYGRYRIALFFFFLFSFFLFSILLLKKGIGNNRVHIAYNTGGSVCLEVEGGT